MPHGDLIFPLTARRRVIGLSFGAMHSARRGMGTDVAGSRPYRAGDDVDAIDWAASAKLSAARNTDEFIVREHYADEAPRVVIVADRRPEMALFPPGLPWLSKPRALATATGLIVESTLAARGYVGYVDHGDGDPQEPFWHPPLQSGSFVFVLSDFLGSTDDSVWIAVRERRWDAVPVVIQDPVWEQGFPDVAGVVVPLAEPGTGRIHYARFSAREVRERRARNEARLAAILEGFRQLDIEPVLVSSADEQDIFWQFTEWSEQRMFWRGQGW